MPPQSLSCRALVLVIFRDIDEVALVEAPLGLGARGHRLGHEGCDASVFAGLEFGAVEVPAVSEDAHPAFTHRLASGLRHLA
ncbi:hypothetical protein FQZ97_1147590 [compost metagenome]